jgi:hypothetical protein
MNKIMLNDSSNFKKGDVVTLNEAGIEFLRNGGFPAIVGALYSSIYSNGAEVLAIKGEYARVKLFTTKFPVTIAKTNDFGVYIEHLKKNEDNTVNTRLQGQENVKRRRGTTVSELLSLFENGITVKAICEELFCVGSNAIASDKALELRRKSYDIAGISESGERSASGYIKRSDLKEGVCKDYLIHFTEADLISDSTPLTLVLKVLHNRQHIFILEGNEVNYIVTRADLQKPAVRILMFGLITLLEMNLTNLILKYYPSDSWQNILSPCRLKKAKDLMKLRQERKEDLSLIDCLELCDKRVLVLKSQKCLDVFVPELKNEIEQKLEAIEKLRDLLAHAQKLNLSFSWEEIIDLVSYTKEMISMCEDVVDTDRKV